jgi:SNF2 family DNA or RNA helicase
MKIITNKIEKENKLYILLDRENANVLRHNINVIRSLIDGKRFKNGIWEINVTYDNMHALMALRNDNAQRIIKDIIDCLYKKIMTSNTINNKINYVTKIYPYKPLSHQVIFTNALISLDTGWCLYFDTGTCKTRIIVDAIYNKFHKCEYTNRHNYKILVVCPKNVKPVWPIELKKYSLYKEHDDIIMIEGTKKQREKQFCLDRKIYIINYDLLTTDKAMLMDINFKAIVFDEIHYVKNISASRTKSAIEISKKCNYVYGLTGTSFSNSELNLFSQAKIINKHIFGDNYYNFSGRYFRSVNTGIWITPKNNKKKLMLKKYILKNELREDLYKKISLYSSSLKKSECLDLPERIYEKRYVSIDNKTLSIYRNVKEELKEELRREGIVNININTGSSKITKLSQLCSGFLYNNNNNKDKKVDIKYRVEYVSRFKLLDLINLLEEIGDNKSIIFTELIYESYMIENFLNEKGIDFSIIKSNYKLKERTDVIDEFKANKNKKCLISNSSLIAEGLTIIEATYSIVYGHTFRPLSRRQMLARNYRYGQKNNVTVIDMICKGMIDEYMLNLVNANIESEGNMRNYISVADLLNSI